MDGNPRDAIGFLLVLIEKNRERADTFRENSTGNATKCPTYGLSEREGATKARFRF
jgi:hypothetical protein